MGLKAQLKSIHLLLQNWNFVVFSLIICQSFYQFPITFAVIISKHTAQKMKFPFKDFFSKSDQIRITFTEEILDVNFHFLCSGSRSQYVHRSATKQLLRKFSKNSNENMRWSPLSWKHLRQKSVSFTIFAGKNNIRWFGHHFKGLGNDCKKLWDHH